MKIVRWSAALLLLLGLGYCVKPPTTIPTMVLTIEAQTLPLALTIGVNPDTSATAPMGYTVQVDAATPVDVGLPATNPSCKAFVGSAVSACVPLPVSIPTTGTHTVMIVGYNLGGSSTGTPITFAVTAPPGNPSNLRVTK